MFHTGSIPETSTKAENKKQRESWSNVLHENEFVRVVSRSDFSALFQDGRIRKLFEEILDRTDTSLAAGQIAGEITTYLH